MRKRKLVTALAAGAIAVVAFAAPAMAHVSIDPSAAEQGGFTKIALRVPNETDNADTIKIDVKLPADHPIGSVSVKPHGGGWTAQVTKAPLATPITTDDGTVTEYISEIAWSGGKIAPGEFDEFELSLGPLPTDATSLAFPTIQTYSDGTEVAWIDPAPAGGGEADHPIPTLTLTAAGGDSTDSSSTASTSSSGSTAASSSSPSGTAAPAPTSTSKDDDSNGLAIVALVVGGLGLIIGIAAMVSARRPPADAP
jgi:uncharacterized protein